jgi:NADPH2:quinone reductase
MRALVCNAFGAPESLAIEEWQTPFPGDSDVVIDVEAAGLNFADVLSIAGRYQVKTRPPFVPGNEAAGTVSAVGQNVTRFAVGDRVIGAFRGGAFQEQAVIDEAFAFPMPAALDFAQAAAYPVAYGTSFHALRQAAELQPGETLLVLGAAGGVGSTAVEIGKAMGARVIAAAGSVEKLAFAREAGADDCINYATTPLRDAITELTGGDGVDVVYDPVGGALAGAALRGLAWHGRYLVVGFASGEIQGIPLNLALLKEARIVGVWWGTWCARHTEAMHRNVQELDALVEAGALRPRVTETYPLEQFAGAFRQITERRVLGKVVLTFA